MATLKTLFLKAFHAQLRERQGLPAYTQKHDTFQEPRLFGNILFIIQSAPGLELFVPKEIAQLAKNISTRQGFWFYNNETVKDGFLIKEIKWTGLHAMLEEPTLEELARFNNHTFGY